MFFDGQFPFNQLGGKSDPIPPINCLWGDPTQLPDGTWVCSSTLPPAGTTPVMNQAPWKNKRVIYVQVPQTTTTTPGTTTPGTQAADDTILGLPKWLAIGGGLAVAGFIFIQMGGKK